MYKLAMYKLHCDFVLFMKRQLDYGSDCMYAHEIVGSESKIPFFRKESDWPARLGHGHLQTTLTEIPK